MGTLTHTAALAASFLLWGSFVQAAPMAYDFSGAVDWVYDPGAVLNASIQPGTEFAGQFTFDSSTQDADPTDGQGLYQGPAFSMTLQVGSYAWFSGTGNGAARVASGLVLSTDPFPIGSGVDIVMVLGVNDLHNSGLFDEALPLQPFSLEGLNTYFFVKGQNVFVQLGGFLTNFTVVPEPACALLLTLGAWFLGRRRAAR